MNTVRRQPAPLRLPEIGRMAEIERELTAAEQRAAELRAAMEAALAPLETARERSRAEDALYRCRSGGQVPGGRGRSGR